MINMLKKVKIIVYGALILGLTSLSVAHADSGVIFMKNNHRSVALGVGDRLMNDSRARSEIQLSHAKVFIGLNTEAKIRELYRNATTFDLRRGSLTLRVSSETNMVYRIRSGNLVFMTKKPGLYRIDAGSKSTTIRVDSGKGQIQIGNQIRVVHRGEVFKFLSNQSVVRINERDRVVRPVIHQRVIDTEHQPLKAKVVIDVQPLVDGLLGRPRVIEHHYYRGESNHRSNSDHERNRR